MHGRVVQRARPLPAPRHRALPEGQRNHAKKIIAKPYAGTRAYGSKGGWGTGLHRHRAPLLPMDIRDLEYFLACCKAESFTAAAREVHIVQSAMSSAIARLERDLGSSRSTGTSCLSP